MTIEPREGTPAEKPIPREENEDQDSVIDRVEIASSDSFPASDPPSWRGGISAQDEPAYSPEVDHH